MWLAVLIIEGAVLLRVEQFGVDAQSAHLVFDSFDDRGGGRRERSRVHLHILAQVLFDGLYEEIKVRQIIHLLRGGAGVRLLLLVVDLLSELR